MKVKISKDYSTVDYIMMEHVYDVTFRKQEPGLKNSDPVKNIKLFGKVQSYVKKKDIIIDVHNRKIIIEHLEDDNPVVETFSLEEFLEKIFSKLKKLKIAVKNICK